MQSLQHPAGVVMLLQVLMVVFEILSSHLHMARWHEAKIDQHTHDLEALHEAGAKMRERLLALDHVRDWSSPYVYASATQSIQEIRLPSSHDAVPYWGLAAAILVSALHGCMHSFLHGSATSLWKQTCNVCRTHQPTTLSCVKQEEASSPSTHHTAIGHLAENGASASSLAVDEDTEDTEEEAANAGIAAVVERTLQQAVVSRSLAAGRSGALGTSDSMEAHASAVPEVGSEPSMLGTLDSLADTEEAAASHPSQQSKTASLDPEQEAEASSATAADASEGATSKAAPGQSGISEQQLSPDHAADSSKSDAGSGSKQDLLDTGQAGSGLPSSMQNGGTDVPRVSTPQPELDPRQPSSPSRAASTTPVKARRRSQADSRALEREYLEGELDALGEKEQEEVGRLAAQPMHHTLRCRAACRCSWCWNHWKPTKRSRQYGFSTGGLLTIQVQVGSKDHGAYYRLPGRDAWSPQWQPLGSCSEPE